MPSQVTTKRGDKGETVTLGGDTLSKSHPILEACGHVDALRAYTALCRLQTLASDLPDREELAAFLYWLSHVYFPIGTQCNDPENKHPEYHRMHLGAGHLERLEAVQAELETRVRLPKQFIVSASTPLAAHFDIACIHARSLERAIVRLKEAVPAFESDTIVAFVNRLSDYLFLVARWAEQGAYATVDYALLEEPPPTST